jgi:hypothetical protein
LPTSYIYDPLIVYLPHGALLDPVNFIVTNFQTAYYKAAACTTRFFYKKINHYSSPKKNDETTRDRSMEEKAAIIARNLTHLSWFAWVQAFPWDRTDI